MKINIEETEFGGIDVDEFREFLKWYKDTHSRPYIHKPIPDHQKTIDPKPGIIYTNALYDDGRTYWAIRINKEGKITADEFIAAPNENICGALRRMFKRYAQTICS